MAFDESCPHSLANRDDAAKQEYWSCLALRETPGIGMRRIAALLSHFGAAYDAVRNVGSWRDAGIAEKDAASFKRETWRQKARLEWDATWKSPCGVVLWTDPEYPVWLRSIADPPPFLYFFGDLSLLGNLAVAVVGMRSCSEEGLTATKRIAGGLAKAGVTIVSGMAKGIDRAAHFAGLEGAGSSIGVLGAGIDLTYPPANRDLYARMREKGLLVSEYPPAFGVDARSFPVRNRIISGISRAVVVVEAAVRSGSLNTANHALEQNRELMAVPGAVSASSSEGCQELVRRGAKAVFSADDVLRELVPLLAEHVREGFLERDLERFRPPRKEKAKVTALSETGKEEEQTAARPDVSPTVPADARTLGLDGLEAGVYDLVRSGPIHVDAICRALGHDAGTVSRVAAILEIRGVLERLPGMRYTAR